MPEPFASFLSPGLEAPIRPMSVTCFESPQQSTFRMHLTSTGRRDQLGQGQGCMMGVRYNPVILCYHQRIPPLLHSSTGPAAGTERPLLCDSGEGWEEGRWGGAQGTAVMPSEESPPGPLSLPLLRFLSPHLVPGKAQVQVTALLLSRKYQSCICTVGPVHVKSISMVS